MYAGTYTLEVDIEWDPRKADSNRRKHGVDFADAVSVLEDELAVAAPDWDVLDSDDVPEPAPLEDVPPEGRAVVVSLVDVDPDDEPAVEPEPPPDELPPDEDPPPAAFCSSFHLE